MRRTAQVPDWRTRVDEAVQAAEIVLERVNVFWAVLAVFVLHVAMTVGFLYPTALFDEFIYLAYARALSGIPAALPNLHDIANQHALYSLYLAPAFRLGGHVFSDVYRVALIENCILAAFTSVAVYGLAREFGVASRGHAVAITLAVACYPSFLLYSTFAVTENLFIPLFAAATWALVRLTRTASAGFGALFGALVGAVYGTHSSGLVVIVAALVALGYGVASRRVPVRPGLIALGALIVASIAANALDKNILVWLYERTNDPSVEQSLVALLKPSSWPQALQNIGGCLFATSVGTLGLFPLGIAYALRRRQGDALSTVYWFVSLAVLGCLVGGSAFLGVYPDAQDRPNYLFATRYLEGVTVVPILLGFVALLDLEERARSVRIAVGMIVVSGLVAMTAMHDLRWFDGPGRRVNVIAFDSLIHLLGPATVASVAALAVLVAVGVALMLMRRAPLLLWCGAFAVIGLSASLIERARVYLPVETALTRGSPNDPLAAAVRAKGGTSVGYDVDAFEVFGYSQVQLQDPEVKLVRFKASVTGVPPLPLIITSRDWRAENYEVVACETFASSCLWARTSSTSALDLEYGGRAAVASTGLYPLEGDMTLRYRWTDGDAKVRLLRVPTGFRGRSLEIVVFAFSYTPIEVIVDGRSYVREHVSGELRKRITLARVPHEIEIKSATFVPKPVNNYTRRLGVELRELTLRP